THTTTSATGAYGATSARAAAPTHAIASPLSNGEDHCEPASAVDATIDCTIGAGATCAPTASHSTATSTHPRPTPPSPSATAMPVQPWSTIAFHSSSS